MYEVQCLPIVLVESKEIQKCTHCFQYGLWKSMESLDSCIRGIKNVWTMALAGCRKNPTYSGYSKVIQIVFRDRDEQIVSNEVYTLGPRYAKPRLQAEKKPSSP